MNHLIDTAKKEIVKVTPDSIEEENNYKLIHCQGKTSTEESTKDERFDVQID